MRIGNRTTSDANAGMIILVPTITILALARLAHWQQDHGHDMRCASDANAGMVITGIIIIILRHTYVHYLL